MHDLSPRGFQLMAERIVLRLGQSGIWLVVKPEIAPTNTVGSIPSC
jgi:hypothetical protein